jgi:rhodanese-related sulfurtransferase
MTSCHKGFCLLIVSLWSCCALAAEESEEYPVPLMAGKPYIHVLHEGRSVRVERIQDPEFELKGYYAKTARKCPPFCIHPMEAAPGVETIGEVELFRFMETRLRDGTGILIDARTPAWYKKGTIPGSVNLPFTRLTVAADDPSWEEMLPQLGVVPSEESGVIDQALERLGLAEEKMVAGKWDFTRAKDLVLFCNGPACDQSPRAIDALLAVGYPAEKLFYYRGGMQMWELWGLTTTVPDE